MRVLWLNLETTGLNTEYNNVLSLSYWPETAPGVLCKRGPRHLRIQPLLHMDDCVWGEQPIGDVVAFFNRSLRRDDPEIIQPFEMNGKALFAFSRSALTYRLDPPAVRDPGEWLLDRTRLSPQRALFQMQEDLADVENFDFHTRWTLAGYNTPFILSVFKYWCERVLKDKKFLNLFNSFYGLDGLALARWCQYRGSLETTQTSLKAVASALGIAYTLNPEEISLSELLVAREVASLLLSGNQSHDHNQKPRIVSREVPSEDLV